MQDTFTYKKPYTPLLIYLRQNLADKLRSRCTFCTNYLRQFEQNVQLANKSENIFLFLICIFSISIYLIHE